MREPDPESGLDRRSFLSNTSTLLMVGGLATGYGTFFAMAGSYLYPSGSNKGWLFVANVTSIAPGDSFPFTSPTGVAVTITRRESSSSSDKGEGKAKSTLAENSARDTQDTNHETIPFVALSSVCPHLGCRVHWESQNDRFFCPCHNGAFDVSGKAIAGPPKTAGQTLPEYPLKIVDNNLYIEMSLESVRKLST